MYTSSLENQCRGSITRQLTIHSGRVFSLRRARGIVEEADGRKMDERLRGSAAALRRTGPAHLLTDADEAVLDMIICNKKIRAEK